MVEEITGHGVESNNVFFFFLINDHAVKLPSKPLCLYHRLEILTNLVREASFAVGRSPWRDALLATVLRIRD